MATNQATTSQPTAQQQINQYNPVLQLTQAITAGNVISSVSNTLSFQQFQSFLSSTGLELLVFGMAIALVIAGIALIR